MRQTLPSRGKSASTKRRSPPGLHCPLAISGHPLPQSSPWLSARLLSRAPGSRDAVTPALPLDGRPPSVGAGKDVLDIVVDQHNVEFTALLAIMPGQLRIGFPLNPVGRLLLAQEDEVVELGGMVAISIGWQADGDFGGYGQPLDDTAVLVVRDTNNHGDSSSSNRV